MSKNQNYGWICPCCGKVNAPFVLECSCQAEEKKQSYGLLSTGQAVYPNDYFTTILNIEVNSSKSVSSQTEPHSWLFVVQDEEFDYYRCEYTGKIKKVKRNNAIK